MTKPLKITLISLGGIVALLLLAILYLSFDGRSRLNVLRHRLFSKSGEMIKEYVIPARRGRILAADGRTLAESVGRYDIFMDCCVVEDEDKWSEESRALSREIALVLPTRSAPEWWTYFQDARQNGKKYIPIVKDIDWPMKDSLAKLPLFRDGQFTGGFIVEHHFARVFPYDSLARRSLGYPRWETPGVGLEGMYNIALSGVNGTRTVKFTTNNGVVRHKEIGRQDPIPGYDVRTTLDMDLQAKADSALRLAIGPDETLYAGCLVLMDVKTGALKAIVNLNRTEDGRLKENYNYAIGRSYEPGDVVSTMTLSAALQDHLIGSLDDEIATFHGKTPNLPQDLHVLDYERTTGKRDITILEGFKRSSQYVMADVALRYKDTPRYYTEGMKALCLPEDLDFDIVGLRDVDIVEPGTYYWTETSLPSMGFGYAWTMTPLHVLAFYNTLAAGGKMMKPYLVEQLEPYDGDPKGFVAYGPKVLKEKVLRPDVIADVTRGLKACVADGTAKVLKDAKYPVAGKTGTARQILPKDEQTDPEKDPYSDSKGRHQYAATFAGFFPADAPQYSIVCTIFTNTTARPAYGGDVPAKVVRELVNNID